MINTKTRDTKQAYAIGKEVSSGYGWDHVILYMVGQRKRSINVINY